MHTIKKNLKGGFVWDNDQMGTNMFLHPYHGNLYYNSARSRGFNYWESGLFALGGSAMWELFMENEYPSINDIIATPIGGLSLGRCFIERPIWCWTIAVKEASLRTRISSICNSSNQRADKNTEWRCLAQTFYYRQAVWSARCECRGICRSKSFRTER
jgi:hypothetical protein